MMAVAITPPTHKAGEPSNGGSDVHVTATLIVRVLLNMHPWLTGISAGRVARVTQWSRASPNLSMYEFAWAIFPSAAVHALYDFVLTVQPVLGLPGIPACFAYCLWRFSKEWKEVANLGQEQAQAPPTEAPEAIDEEGGSSSSFSAGFCCCCSVCSAILIS